MDDRNEKLNRLLSTPQGRELIRSLADMLDEEQKTQGAKNPPRSQSAPSKTAHAPDAKPPQPSQGTQSGGNSGSGGFDLSAMLRSLSQGQGQSAEPSGQQGTPDLSALLSSLSQGNGGGQGQGSNGAMPDLSALLSSLSQGSGGGQGQDSNGSMPDLSALLSSLSQGNGGGQGQGSNGAMPDLSALLSSLSQGNNGGQGGGGLSSLMGLLGQSSGAKNSPVNAELLLKLAPMLSSLGQDDDRTRLLSALRPHLGAKRQKKLDEAAQLLRLSRLLPLLQEQGIFKSLL